MPRALLLDTNRAAVPLYQALLNKGHEVWVVGRNPSETLAKMCTNYSELDYSDLDALSAFIEENKFDFLVPGCTDLSYLMCSMVGAGKFPGIDTQENTIRINSKNEFKELLQKLELSAPRLLSEQQAVNHPSVIVKPVDSYSGQGIRVLSNPDSQQLTSALDFACEFSKSGKSLIEEYICEQLYSYSCFLREGRVVVGFFVQEDGSANPFSVDTSQVIDNISNLIRASLESDVSKIAKELGISDGLVHLQFLCDGTNYWIIEMTRRCPGDIYALLIEYATGYRYADSYIAPFIGEPVGTASDFPVRQHIIRHTIASETGQTFWGLQIDRAVKVKLFVPLVTSGEMAQKDEKLRLGIIFIEADSGKEQAQIYQQLISRRMYRLDFSGENNEK